MKNKLRYTVLPHAVAVLPLLLLCTSIYAENIDRDNDGHQWSWGENVGWLDFEPNGQGGVSVGEYALSGAAWGENIGWIYLDPNNFGGVTNDGHGHLGGSAWGENVGWIYFSGAGYGVVIDPTTGLFSGQAWGENVGWINFSLPSQAVRTFWRPNRPPVANAGPNQALDCSGAFTTAQLNGSGSYDPDANSPDPDNDDTIVAYQWAGGSFFPSDEVVNPTVDLALGSHAFTLTAFDSFAAEDSDSVSVTISDSVDPVVVAPKDISIQHTYPLNNAVPLGEAQVTETCDQAPVVENDAPADFPLGVTLVTWTATDASGNSGGDTQNVELLNATPVADPQTVSLDEDSYRDIVLNASDINGDPIGYTVVSGPAHGALSGSAPNLTYTPVADYFGPDAFVFEVSDPHATGNQATVDISVVNVNDAPTLQLAGNLSSEVQYSDGIGAILVTTQDIDDPSTTLSASYKVDGGAEIDGLPAGLEVTEPDCLITTDNAVDPHGSTCEWRIDGNIGGPAGVYEIIFSVADAEPLTASSSTSITVIPEQANVAIDKDNPVAVEVDQAGGDSGSFELQVDVTERLPDASTFSAAPGDIGNALVSVDLVPVGPGTSLETQCAPASAGPLSDGYAQTLTVVCTFDDVPVNTYAVEVHVASGYYTGFADDVLTVYDPSLGFTTGGGRFFWPGTNDRTNFGYTIKYNRKQTNIQGSLMVIRHVEGAPESEGIWRLKSNSLEGLSLGDETDFGWAAFSGKATFQVPGGEAEGNHAFVVYVEDFSEPGAGSDRFWLQVHDKQDELVGNLSMDDPAVDEAAVIDGGNIIVPYGAQEFKDKR